MGSVKVALFIFSSGGEFLDVEALINYDLINYLEEIVL